MAAGPRPARLFSHDVSPSPLCACVLSRCVPVATTPVDHRHLHLRLCIPPPPPSSLLLSSQPDVAVECSGYILEELRDPVNFEQFKKDVEGANIFIGSLIFVQVRYCLLTTTPPALASPPPRPSPRLPLAAHPAPSPLPLPPLRSSPIRSSRSSSPFVISSTPSASSPRCPPS